MTSSPKTEDEKVVGFRKNSPGGQQIQLFRDKVHNGIIPCFFILYLEDDGEQYTAEVMDGWHYDSNALVGLLEKAKLYVGTKDED